MEKLSHIEVRLQSLGELGELVGALRSMSASRSREAQDAFAGTLAYCATVRRAIAEVVLLGGTAWQNDREDTGSDRVLVVITSEHGFVGLFNARLFDYAMELKKEDETLVIVGRRGQILAAERGVADVIAFPMTARTSGITATARRIAARITSFSAARIVFARYECGVGFAPDIVDVLPLEESIVEDAGDNRPVTHLPPTQLIRQLATEYLFAEIARRLMETLASENGARLRAMDNASRNIEEKIARLRRDEHVARQEVTTTEMLDVVTGAEAVSDH